MTVRYRLFHVDDEISENFINHLVDWGLVPSLAPGVATAASDGPWSCWDPRLFATTFSPHERDLVEIVLGLENAFEVFQKHDGHFAIVVLDVNLESFGLGSFGGLSLHDKIVDYLSTESRLGQTLPLVYTASTKVLERYEASVVGSVRHYRDLRRSGRTIVIRADEADPADPQDFGGLLRGICEDFLTAHSRRRFLSRPEHVRVLEELRDLSGAFDRNRLNGVAQMTVDGWEMRHLFPFQFGAIGGSVTDAEAAPLVEQLYRTLRGSFRLRFAEFCDLLEKEVQAGTPLRHIRMLPANNHAAWLAVWTEILDETSLDAFGDLEELHPNDRRFVELRSIVRQRDKDRLVQWVETLRAESTDYLVEGELQQGLSAGSTKGWFFLKPDYERIREVIHANAARHESVTTLPKILVKRGKGDSFEVCCRTGDGPGEREDVARGLGRAFSKETQSKLAELRHLVCGLYDGEVMIESSAPTGERWAVKVGGRGTEVSFVEPERENGTWYLLRFPKGRW